jgi:hypothetical protein
MRLDHFDTPSVQPTKTVCVEFYPNNGEATLVNDVYTHIRYSNGDQIWLEIVGGTYKVVRIFTDGKVLDKFSKHPYGDPNSVGGGGR